MTNKSETFKMLLHFFNHINRKFNKQITHSTLEMARFFFLNFKLFVPTMVLNSSLNQFNNDFLSKVFNINEAALRHPKKMVLSNANIITFLMLLVPYDF